MFWQKSFVLLGLLAGWGSATPALSKHLDLETQDEEYVFFRADRYVSLTPGALPGYHFVRTVSPQHTPLGSTSEYS
jgi:hypothetical protein